MIGVLILLYTAQSLLSREYSAHYPGKSEVASPVFTVVSGLTTTVVSLFVCGFRFDASPLTVLLGLTNAAAIVAYNDFLIRASQKGAYSILMIFGTTGGILIPAFGAHFLLSEKLTVLKVICMLGAIIAAYFISQKDDEKTKPTKSFLMLCFLLALANGVYSLLLALQGEWTGAEEKAEMVAITFFCASVVSAVMLFCKTKKDFLPSFKQTRTSLIYLIAASLVVATAVHMLTFVLELIDTAVLYTFDTSGVLLLSLICSCVFFKEKMNRKNIIGMVLMIISLLAMSPLGENLISSLF